MKALVLQPGTKNLQLKEWKEPEIQKPDEIKVEVLSVGICGTDREEAGGGRADAPAGEKELIIGHEMVSRVVAVGKGVKNFKPGDHLVFTVRRGCQQCPACALNRFDLCLTGNYTERGIKGRHGYQTQFVVDQECYAIKVPASIAPVAVMTEPMSVVQKALDESRLIQRARLPYLGENWLQGKTALVAGLGPIGLLAAVVLRLRGANVLGLDIIEASSPRVKIFEALGGVYFNDKTLDEAALKKAYPQVDLVLDAAGVAKLDFDLMDFLGVNGLFVLTGVPGDQRLLNVDGAKLMRVMVLKNQVLVGSVNADFEHFRQGIADFEAATKKWPGVVEKMISQRYAYTDYAKVFSAHSPDEIKVVLDWGNQSTSEASR